MVKISQIETFKNKVESCENINLIIGPNNSGKTFFLKEIYNGINNVTMPTDSKWINSLKLTSNNLKKVAESLIPKVFEVDKFEPVRNIINAGYKSFLTNRELWNEHVFQESRQLADEEESEYTITKTQNKDRAWHFWRFILNNLAALEDCEHRLRGPYETNINNLIEVSEGNVLSYLFKNQNVLDIIKKNIRDVFGIDIGFDNLQQGLHPLRILPKKKIKGETSSIETALEWQENSPLIKDEGDGIKAYLQLVFSLLQPQKSIIIIDEPEAFLHPPQCRALGNLVAKLSDIEDKQLFIASHSPEFLRGVLSSGVSRIKILYLKRNDSVFDYAIFNANDIEVILRSKSNLINERILNSFFYKKTVLCEDENDRLFYEHASAKYLWDLFQDVNFVGLNGKGQVQVIFWKLKKLGLQVAMVVDIDFLIDESFPSEIQDANLKQRFENYKNSFSRCKSQGILQREDFKKLGVIHIKKKQHTLLTSLENLIEDLCKYNIFVVPVGELESWTRGDIRGIQTLQQQLNVIQSKIKRSLKKFLEKVLT